MKFKLLISLLLTSVLSWAQTPVNVRLTTDQPFYFSGQTIKMFYQIIDAAQNQIIPTNEIVYLVLKSKDSNNIFEQKVHAKEGTGELSVSLPIDIQTGYYELIAFTHYMNNQEPSSYFRQKVTIYNPKDDKLKTIEKSSGYMKFYPEGGHLIDGISSRVVYHHSGPCDNNEAQLTNQKNKTVLSFAVSESGIGSLFFKPNKNQIYQVEHFCSNISTSSFSLPKVKAVGSAFSITKRNNKIQLLARIKGKSIDNDSIKFVGFSKEIKVYESIGIPKKGILFAEVPKHKLPYGQMSFYLLNEGNDILGTRHILIDHKEIDTLTVDLPKNIFSTQEEITFSVSSSSDNPNISAYVIPENLHQTQTNKITDGLDIKFNTFPKNIDNSIQSVRLLDDIMIINSSQRMSLPKPFVDSKTYWKEDKLSVRGKFTDSKPLPDTTELFFFIPGINLILQAIVDSTGVFEFPVLFEFHDKQNIVFYPRSEKHKYESPSIVSDDFSVATLLDLSEIPLWTHSIQKEKLDYLKRKKVMSFFEFYTNNEVSKKSENTIVNIHEMLPEADAIFKPDEYSLFPTMEETIKEIVVGLWVRNKKEGKVLRMFHTNWIKEYVPEFTDLYNPTPFIIINNLPSSVDDLLSLNPSDIKEIRLINEYKKLSYVMPFGSGGVVIVSLKENAEHFKNKKLLTFSAMGITSKTKQNGMESNPKNIPDMRSTLLWKPNQKITDGKPLKINFQTSSRPGKYLLIVESIGDNGQIGYKTAPIQVKFADVH